MGGVNFTPGSAKRIANTVKAHEGTPLNLAGRKGHQPDILGGAAYRRFELKDDLDADNTAATAYLLNYDSTGDTYEIDDSTEFEVYSFIGWTGTARVAGPPVVDGTRGWCVQKAGRWEVVGGGGGGGDVKFAKLDATLHAGGSCTASIWSGDPLADSGNDETVYDWFLESGMKLESGVKVRVTLYSGKWYADQSDTCPVAQ